MQVNREFYPDYGTFGEYKYSKPIEPNNYGSAELDKSITFSSSPNSPLGSYAVGFTSEISTLDTLSWKGHNIIAPLNITRIFPRKEAVSNLIVGNDDNGYLSDNRVMSKYDRRWGGDNSDSKISPYYNFPLYGVILTVNVVMVDEIYCNPSDDSSGEWIYLTSRSYYNLRDFETFINDADTATHKRIEYYVKRVTLGVIHNSAVENSERACANLALVNANKLQLDAIVGTKSDGTDWRTAQVEFNNYYSYQLQKIISGNGTRLIDCELRYASVNYIDPSKSDYKGGSILIGTNLGELESYPYPSSTNSGGVTNCSQWITALKNVTPEKIRQGLACLGFLFLTDYTYSNNGYINLTSAYYQDRVYVPINIDGFYTGKYQKLKYLVETPSILLDNSEKKSLEMFTATDETAGELPFINGNSNPNSEASPIDPNEESKVTDIELNTPNISTISVFNTCYAMNKTGIDDLNNYLWNNDNNIFERLIENAKLYNKPMDAIIKLMLFPFDVRRGQGGTVKNVTFGRETLTGVNGVALPSNMRTVFDLGYAYLYRKFEDFRDYEPYTTATLYIPYCAPLKLSATIYQGKKISVKMVVDYNTGDCTAVIYADGIPVDYSNGKCGVSISVSAADSSRYDNKVINDVMNTAKSAEDKNIGGGLYNAFQTFQDFDKIDILQKGATSSGVSQTLPQYCYLIVTRPVSDEQAGYNNSVGYACNKWQTLGSKSGFVVVENPNMEGLSATDEEKERLRSLLENGVYI